MADFLIVIMPFIITIIVFIVVISSIKRNVKAAAQKKPLTKNTSVPLNMRADKTHKSASNISEMEDKSHDWLAQQIAYEQSAKVMVDDMFSLRREHEASCDAKNVKKLHEKHCDAGGIDTGQH